MGIPERIDADLDKQVKAKQIEAKKRPHFTEYKGHNRRYQKTITINPRILGPSSAIALGDLIRQKIISTEKAKALMEQTVVHVKNGKPLTAHGAKLLGVPWPE